jgi:hypothetical protein
MVWGREKYRQANRKRVVVQFDKEASQTRDYCVANNATRRAARPDSSRRKERLFGMTIKLHHYPGMETQRWYSDSGISGKLSREPGATPSETNVS